MKIAFILLLQFLLFANPFPADSAEKDTYICGIAIGFPPYQYEDKNKKPAGIDYEITKLVFKNAGLNVTFVQSEWDDVLFNLAHKTGKVDLLCGAEISSAREKLFDFSTPYSRRHIVIFTLKSSKLTQISDLYGKIIAGDRDSFFEKYLGEDRDKIRVKETFSKEESFAQLKDGRVVAVIAPKEVGYYLCREMGLAVKILEEKDPGSPIAFAVGKGNTILLQKINASLKELIQEGKIEQILRRYK